MDNSLIIDSSQEYAAAIHDVLDRYSTFDHISILDPSSATDLGKLSDEIVAEAGDDTVVLINVESTVANSYLQDQTAVELAFWLRCKHRAKFPIVFYSFRSAGALLRSCPGNFVLLSPGIYNLRFPFSRTDLQSLASLGPVERLASIKPFLKPAINLARTRHVYANYFGMVLMSDFAKQIWQLDAGIIPINTPIYPKLLQFLNSLDYHVLHFYFDLDRLSVDAAGAFYLRSQLGEIKILLVDDLGEVWKPIISQMLFGNPFSPSLDVLEMPSCDSRNGNRDEKSITERLRLKIEEFRPEIVLLDLRLQDERGKQDVEELSGFKLLAYIKQHSVFKGLTVIMFTASRDAETAKKLLAAGADAVWTKPGIDEELRLESLLDRYKSLVFNVRKAATQFRTEIKLESAVNLEESRFSILRRTDFIKYRARLSKARSSSHYFNGFTDIFIDTSCVLENAECLCNTFKLAHICDATQHAIIVDGVGHQCRVPKVVLHNYVIDEIIHHSKRVNPSKPYFWKTALVAYEVLRELFVDDLARTELNSFESGSMGPKFSLWRAKDVAADEFIIESIIQVLSGMTFDLFLRPKGSSRSKKATASYATKDPRVLLLTKESQRKPGQLPDRLLLEYEKLPNPRGTVEVIGVADFNKECESIIL